MDGSMDRIYVSNERSILLIDRLWLAGIDALLRAASDVAFFCSCYGGYYNHARRHTNTLTTTHTAVK